MRRPSDTGTPAAYDLAQLLGRETRASFFEQHWERKPLHVARRDEHFYDGLLTLGDLERLIASPEARYPAIQLSKEGAYFPPEVYCSDVKFGAETFSGVPDVEKIAAEYRAGASIVLPALHRTWAPLKTVCAALEADLSHAVHANAYLTPGNTAGFSPHYDTHEVLILQISGKKHWRIDEPPIQLPHRKQPFNPAGYVQPKAPWLELELEAGDLLYLPRGTVHSTTTSAVHSAHVTVGVAIYTWLDLAGEALQAALSSPVFRQALPPGFAHHPAELPTLARGLRERLQTLGHMPSEALVEMFLKRMRPSPAADENAFNAAVVVIDDVTLLQSPAPTEYRIVAHRDKVAVEFQQRRIIVPSEARVALGYMQGQRSFRPVDLPADLGREANLTLVRSLHDRGFLTLVRD